MSALAVYFGTDQTSFLLENDSTSTSSLEFFNFPYVYTPELFSNYISAHDFYSNLIESFLRKHFKTKASLEKVTIVTTCATESALEIGTKFPLSKVLTATQFCQPFFVDSVSLSFGDQKFSSLPSSFLEPQKKSFSAHTIQKDQVLSDYIGNIAIYPNMVASSFPTRLEFDKLLFANLQNQQVQLPKNQREPFVFTGGRFSSFHRNVELQYALILDLLSQEGIRQIYTDPQNSFILLNLLSLLRNGDIPVLDTFKYFTSLGTQVRVNTSAEFLIDAGIGSPQIIDLKAGSLFVVPMESTTRAKLLVKTADSVTIEKTVSGGKLGLILDTRHQNQYLLSDVTLLNNFVKQVSSVLC